MLWAPALALVIAALVVANALKTPQKGGSPWEVETMERSLTVVIDVSGSSEQYGYADRAWEMLERALDQEFRVGGSTGKVIIAQVSGSDDPVVFIGTPMQLRQAYPSFDVFKQALLKKATPGSRVYDGIADALDASSLQIGNPVSTLLVFSDMEDTTGRGRDRLLKALDEFGRRKEAAAGFYFVKKEDVRYWGAAVKARVKHAIVTTPAEQFPPLPQRD
jgi:hypothetical protein